ncbi:MAG: nucleotidyl transferase AbiEii/AbiGii toxin family protein [bacterium]|nr:nucleotidyl transferase AbiEii/AbiGii toxin family protein [bacterium]
MGTEKTILKNIIEENFDKAIFYKRNLLKEYLQILVLDFIYSNEKYSPLVFYGGSCLAHCFGLQRLSEDLDFVDTKKEINLEKLAVDLEIFFKKNTDLPVEFTVQKFRIHLKFPILKELGLSVEPESDILILKLEIFSDFDFCQKYQTQIKPLFKFNKSILIKTFDLPTLMSTKIRALLYRKWEKKNKDGKVLINVKGRDYFDLMWYLEKDIEPNFDCLEIKTKDELKEKLLDLVNKVDENSIILDLENFIADKKFVIGLGKNIKNILRDMINKKF